MSASFVYASANSLSQAPKGVKKHFLSRARVLIAAGHGARALLTHNQGLSQRCGRSLKLPPQTAPHSHSTAISRGQIDDLRQGGASVAAPSAPSPRPTRPNPAHVGAMEHEQGRGGVGVLNKPFISG
jgi:hypothetical protein